MTLGYILLNYCLLSAMARETLVQSQIASYQILKKWYLMPPCLTLSIIRYRSRVKRSNPGKGVAPSPIPWCSSYRKGSLWVILGYGRQFLDTTYFTFAEEYFIRFTSLHDRRLTAPNITAQLNQCHEKMFQHPLWGEDSVKLAYIVELLSRNHCWESKTISNGSGLDNRAVE